MSTVKIIESKTNYNSIIISGKYGKKLINYKSTDKVLYSNKKFLVPSNHTLESLLNSLLFSVNKGYFEILKVSGVGFKIELQNNKILLYIGFKSPQVINIPDYLKVEAINATSIKIIGSSKLLVTNFKHKIINIKPAYKDRYKQKGIL